MPRRFVFSLVTFILITLAPLPSLTLHAPLNTLPPELRNVVQETFAAEITSLQSKNFTQQAKLIGSENTSIDHFGISVALESVTAVVGVPTSPNAFSSHVYVFVRNEAVWVQQAKLTSSDGAQGSWFGVSVALSGNTIIVGADDSTDDGINSAAAYIYVRNGSTWTQQAKISAVNVQSVPNTSFGRSVAIQGNIALIGAGETVFTYVRNGTIWTQQSKLSTPDNVSSDFGHVIALDGNTAIIGAPDYGGYDPAAYIFIREEETWVQQAKLTASDSGYGDYFGYRVALDGDKAIVGALYNDNENGEQAGAAYIFTRSGSTWAQQAKLIASDGAANDKFGYAVAINGDTAFIGAPDNNDTGTYSGSTYVFVRNGTTWTQNIKLNASSTTPYSRFGYSIALDGDYALIGAPFGAQGSAYVFSSQNTPPQPANLVVDHVEITQVVQDELNNIPLVRGKPTFIRVYLNCSAANCVHNNVTGVLRNEFNEVLTPINSFVTVKHSGKWQDLRKDIGKTLNFRLPANWVTQELATYTIEVGGLAPLSFKCENSAGCQFNAVANPRVILVPINYLGKSPDLSRIKSYIDGAKVIYPFTEFSAVFGEELNWSRCFLPTCVEQLNPEGLINALERRYSNVNAYVFGWLPSDSFKGNVAGKARIPGRAAIGEDLPNYGSIIFAHEFGHLLGLPHPHPLCKADNSIPAYIDNYGIDVSPKSQFSLLISSNTVVKSPQAHYDIMHYCDPYWISTPTYRAILNAFKIAPLPKAEFQGRHLLFSGIVTKDNQIEVDPIFVSNDFLPQDDTMPGNTYCIQFRGVQNEVITQKCFDLNFTDSETGEASYIASFFMVLPFSENTSSLSLVKGTTELVAKPVSVNPPTVQISYPNNNELWGPSEKRIIKWVANDADNDSLFFRVEYSTDNATWMPLAQDIQATQLEIDTSKLSGGQVSFRVVVSDGFNTTSDISDASITLGNHKPQPYIISPTSSMISISGKRFIFEGNVYDLEDTVLSGNNVSWTSSIDGFLGTGETIEVDNLSVGQHVITFSATDSQGAVGSTQSQLTIAIPSSNIPATSPNLISPINNSVVSTSLIPALWSKVSLAYIYQLQVDNSIGFDTPTYDLMSYETKYDLYLNSPGVYYWRVRPVNELGEGLWSETWSFIILPDDAGQNNLVSNGGFESKLDAWKVKGSGVKGDKVKCNKDTDGDGIADKVVANSGECAFRFKGGEGEKSSLEQVVDVASQSLSVNDVLTLSATINGRTATSGKIKVRVKYNDATSTGKLNLPLGATNGYSVVTGSVEIKSIDIKKIKVQFQHTGLGGKSYVDDVSLSVDTGQHRNDELLPLPSTSLDSKFSTSDALIEMP